MLRKLFKDYFEIIHNFIIPEILKDLRYCQNTSCHFYEYFKASEWCSMEMEMMYIHKDGPLKM